MDNETQQNPQSPTGGLKLMTVFIVVLVLHVIVIGGIGAYTLLKGNGESAPVAQQVDELAPVSELKENASTESAPITAEKPMVEAATAPTPIAPVIAEPVAETVKTAPVNPPVATAPAVQHPAVAPAPVTEPAPVVSNTAAADKSAEYTVKTGDTLTKIARIHGMRLSELRAMNSLGNDALKIGQKLKVTSKAAGQNEVATTVKTVDKASRSVVSSATPEVKTSAKGGATYTVMKGDTLTKIARQFRTTPAAIMQANNINDAHKLKIGMRLSIPGGHQEASESQAIPTGNPVQPTESFDLVKR